MQADQVFYVVVGTFVLVTAAQAAVSADVLDRPTRIVTGETGGAADLVARLLAPGMSSSLGRQIVVDNRGTGAGAMAAQIVAKAPPDGHTMLLYGNSIWLLPFLRSNVAFDAVRDFAPITAATSAPVVLTVHSSLPVSSVRELIAYAASRPGALNYGSGPTGTASHLTAELFKSMANVSIVRVPYKGSAPAVNDLVAGRVQLMFAPAAAVATHIKSGRLTGLAITSAQPSLLFPELPAIAASGLPGYEASQILGLLAPAQTSTTVLDGLNQEIVRVLRYADVKDRLSNAGLDTVANTRQEFAAMRAADMARMGKVIIQAGIREE